MNNSVLIAGKPNTGKTSAFNLLTGKFLPVGNRQGVTVSEATAEFKYKGAKYRLFDIPGAYALDGGNMEEKSAADRIKNFGGIIVYFAEAVKLKSDLSNLKKLMRIGKKIILVVNMAGEFYKRGGKLDIEMAKKFFPFPVLVGDFNKKKDVLKLKEAIYSYKFEKGDFGSDSEFDEFYIPANTPVKVDVFIKYPLLLYFSFILFTALIFYIAFGNYGLGGMTGSFIEKSINEISGYISEFFVATEVSPFLIRLVTVGIIEGMGSVLKFLPQVLILKFFLDLMEFTGYLSRVAFSLDGLFSKVGLNGRAVFAMLMGFGCTSVAVTQTRGLENERIKRRVVGGLGYISCSAKIPVYFLLASAFDNPYLIILAVYFSGLILAFFYAYIESKITAAIPVPLILEIPPYRRAEISNLLKSLLKCAEGFIIKIGTVIVLVSSASCIFSSVSGSFAYVGDDIEKSVLANLGKATEFLFLPIGVKDWRISTAVLSGVFAKESIVSTLCTLSGDLGKIPPKSIFALIVFVMSYTPCLTAVFTVKEELGGKFALLIAAMQFICAYLLALFIYLIEMYPLPILSATAVVIIYAKIHSGKKRKIIKNTV